MDASSGAGAQVCDKRDRLWVRYSLNEVNIPYFNFTRSANQAKHAVEFHSTRNALRIQKKMGNESVLSKTEYLNY